MRMRGKRPLMPAAPRSGSASAPCPLAAARQQLVEDRHPHHQPRGDLLGDQRLRRLDHLRGQLDPPVHRPGVHQELARVQPAAVDLVVGDVLAHRGQEGVAHALVLHAQRVDDVRVGDAVEVVADLAPEGLDVARDQRRRPADGDPRAHPRERVDVRAGDAAVQHVADDPDVRAVERSEPAAQGVDVEQRLARVLVLAVAGVHHRGGRVLGDDRRRARPRRPDHDRGRVVGRQRRDRVAQRLALVDRRAVRAHAHEVGRQPLGGQLERGAGARAGLVEEVDDRAAAERRHLLDVALHDLAEALGHGHDALDVST